MIAPQTYTIEWLNKISAENQNADKILLEKVIHALTLLVELQKNQLDFIFKGGTALMLMLNKPSRLSIDIDIIVPDRSRKVEPVLNKVLENERFNRYEKQERFVASGIVKEHYKFFYNPIHKTQNAEEYILLDILFEENPYAKLARIPVNSFFLKLSGESVHVKVPTFECMLGDKLTAFAPETTGIPYYKGNKSMSMEIIKQLYDIGNLFHKMQDVDLVGATFHHIARKELQYRAVPDKTPADVLDNIFETALCIASREKMGNCKFADLQKGINRIKTYIFSHTFLIENAIITASKAAYLAALIKTERNEINLFSPDLDLTKTAITNTHFNKLNKLKRTLPEAFYYWYLIV